MLVAIVHRRGLRKYFYLKASEILNKNIFPHWPTHPALGSVRFPLHRHTPSNIIVVCLFHISKYVYLICWWRCLLLFPWFCCCIRKNNSVPLETGNQNEDFIIKQINNQQNILTRHPKHREIDLEVLFKIDLQALPKQDCNYIFPIYLAVFFLLSYCLGYTLQKVR